MMRFFAVTIMTEDGDNISMKFFDNYTEANKLYNSVNSSHACLEEIKKNNEVQHMAGNEKLSIQFYTRVLENED